MWWEGGKKQLQQYRHRCAVADHIHSETGTVTVLVSKKRTEKTERVTIIYRWRTSQALSTSSDNASWGLLLTSKATRFWRRDSAPLSPISLTLMSSPHLRLQVSLCFHLNFLLIICFSSVYSLVITHFNRFLLLLFIRVSLSAAKEQEAVAVLKLLTLTAKIFPGVFHHGKPAAVLPIIARILPSFAEPAFRSLHSQLYYLSFLFYFEFPVVLFVFYFCPQLLSA